MYKKILQLLSIIMLSTNLTYAQQGGPDCSSAATICSGSSISINPSGIGNNDFNSPGNNDGCLNGERNSTWFYFEFNSSTPANSDFTFVINASVDYDFALFGPNPTDCSSLGSPLRCSYAVQAGPTGLSTGANDVSEGVGGDRFVSEIQVDAGFGYFLLVNNHAGGNVPATISFGGQGSNYLDCDATPFCSISVGADATPQVCQDESFVLNSNVVANTNNVSFEWQGDNGADGYLFPGPNSEFPTVTPPSGFTGTLVYRLVVTDNDENCSSTSTDVTIQVVPLPNIQIQDPGLICSLNDPVFLNGSPGVGTGTWGGAANGNGSIDPSNLGPGSHLVTYEYTDNSGCTNTGSTNIAITESPGASIIGDLEFCEEDIEDGNAFLDVDGFGGLPGYSYSWSTPDGIDNNKEVFIITPGPYSVVVTDANGCTFETPVVQVGVTPPPDVIIISPGVFCGSSNAEDIFVDTFEDGVGAWDTSTGIINDIGTINPAALGPGVYEITYNFTSNVTGCFHSESDDIRIASPPTAEPSTNPAQCNSADIELFGNSSAANATYSWTGPDGFTSNEQNPAMANGPGTYFLTTSISGCQSVPAELEVVVGNAISPTITGTPDICAGGSTTLSVPGYDSYVWSEAGEVNDNIEVSTTGTYSVTVSDASGCTGEASFLLTVNNNPVVQIGGSNTFCTGTTTTLDAGDNYTDYIWSDGGATITQTLEVSVAGDYFVTVTDQNGCTGETSVTVSESSSLNPTITGLPSFCTGESTTLSAGSGFTSYQWSNGEITNDIIVTMTGTYEVTVSDASGCTGENSIIVTANNLPVLSISGNVPFCEGEEITLEVNGTFDAYDWGSSLNSSLEVTEAGDYSVTVTDANGCTNEDMVTVVTNAQPIATIDGATSFCSGNDIILTGPAGMSGYEWTGGSTEASIIVSTGGEYGLTVTNNGCTDEASILVTESASLTPMITGETIICENDLTTLDAGNGFAGYNWESGFQTQTVSVTQPGIYTVTVSDAAGCTGETFIEVMQNTTPIAELTSNPVTLCNTSAEGSTLDFGPLVISGDQGGNWVETTSSGASGTFPNLDFDGVIPGEYTFVYTTNSAIAPCVDPSYTITITVEECACPGVNLNTPAPLCNVDGSLDLSTLVNSGPDGSWMILSTPAGISPANLNNTILEAANADQGTYTLQYTLIDAVPNGCETEFTVDLEINRASTAGVANAPLDFCSDEGNTVDLFSELIGGDTGGNWTIIQGDAAGYDNGDGSFITNGQPSGTYVFQYELMANGACPGDTELVTININELPTAEAGTGTTLVCGMNDFMLTANGTTGNDIQVSWTGPGMITDGDTYTPTITSPGIFTLTVENTVTGCSSTDIVEIMQDDDVPVVNVATANPLTCDSLSVVLFSNTDLTTPVDYSWTGPNGFVSMEQYPSVNTAGEYFVTIFNPDNNCTSSPALVMVMDNSQTPTIDIVVPLDPLDCDTDALLVDASGSQGGDDLSFSWTNSDNEIISTAAAFEITSPGNYELMISNMVTGCTAMGSFMIEQDITEPIPSIATPGIIDCNNPSVIVTGTSQGSGNNPIYNWYDINGNLIISDNADFAATSAGIYTLEVVNGENQCSATTEVTVMDDLATPIVNISNPDMLDCTVTEITLSGEGSDTGDNIAYEWQNAVNEVIGTNLSVEITDIGNYELIVTNTDNGCTAQENVAVENNGEDIETAVIITEPSDCFEADNAVIIFSEVMGGTAPFNYSIGDEVLSAQNAYFNLSPGVYEVTVEDALGCEWETEVTVTEPDELDLTIDLNLEADQSLFFGDSLILNANTFVPDNQIDTLIWNQPNLIRCEDEDCYEGVVNNLFDPTSFSATLIDTAGCTVTATVAIGIEKEREIYIPNSFSPNDDGINDIFFINGGRGIDRINSFIVYNRWGEVVYSNANFQPNDPDQGWDGTFRSKGVNPAVFVYVAEIKFIDGFEEMYSGDVTVIK